MSAIHDKQVSQEKKEIVASLKEELTSAKGAVLTSYKGLTVAQDTQLRRALREAGVSYHVVKNTLTTIAAKDAGMEALIPHLAGTTALASSKEDAVVPAKVISEFIKKNKLADAGILTVKAGLVEGKDIMIKNVGVFPKLKLKEMDYIELVREANRFFPDFSLRLLREYPDLNGTDFRHGCLALLGMNDAQLAVLEGISYSGSNRRTNKFIDVLKLGDNLQQALLTYLKMHY